LIANVNRKDLFEAARKAARAAARETAILPIKGILLEADEACGVLRLTATDTNVTIRADVPAYVESGGAAVVNAKIFVEYLALAPGENLCLELKSGGILRIGTEERKSCRLDLRTLPAEEYPTPELPMPGETVCVTGLKSLTAASCFIASQSGACGCVNMVLRGDGLAAEAISGFGLAKVRGAGNSTGRISMLIPVPALKTLAAVSSDRDVFELGVTGTDTGGKTAVFFDGTLLFAARLMEGTPADTEKIFAGIAGIASANARAKDVKDAIDSATAFASANDSVKISFADGGILFACETAQGDSSSFAAASSVKPSPRACFCNAERLAECAGAISGDITLTMTDTGHLLIESAKARYLQFGCAPKKTAQSPAKKEKPKESKATGDDEAA
jgi:DNA polymerase III sliding clamp (beta) subunit (PCNA family)